jgi:hypothetical protein
MATDTTALISIEKIVTQFLLSYKKTTEDYTSYLSHALNCFQDFNLYDGNIATTAKVTINSTLKCIDMPDDMLSFIDLVTPINGEWWSFTEKRLMVNTTTTTNLVEGRDDTQGEGATVKQDRVTGYGARGGWNKFRYTLDWAARRIYVDDAYEATDYIVLIYVSSGIKATGETTVPAFLIPVIDSYLLEKETFWIPSLARERDIRHRDYWAEKRKVRDLINSMSYNQWKDILLENTTQTIQR